MFPNTLQLEGVGEQCCTPAPALTKGVGEQCCTPAPALTKDGTRGTKKVQLILKSKTTRRSDSVFIMLFLEKKIVIRHDSLDHV